MYRQYEDPRALQKELDELQCKKEDCINEGKYDEEAMEYFALRSAELRDRINFAWQDEEYLANQARYDY